nr:unnamed protein product [Callosobruchus analis]
MHLWLSSVLVNLCDGTSSIRVFLILYTPLFKILNRFRSVLAWINVFIIQYIDGRVNILKDLNKCLQQVHLPTPAMILIALFYITNSL